MPHNSIHQHEDAKYPSNSDAQKKVIEDNDSPRPPRHEHIVELETAAGSEEGMHERTDDQIDLREDVKEDRENNTEGRLPDIPESAITR